MAVIMAIDRIRRSRMRSPVAFAGAFILIAAILLLKPDPTDAVTSLSVPRVNQTLMIFYTSAMDDRLDMTLASAFLLLNRSAFDGFQTTLRLFFLGPLRRPIDDQLEMLRTINRNVNIVVDFVGDPLDLADRAGMRYASNFSVPCSLYDVPMVLTRLFIPRLYPADWYLYIDSDVVVVRGISWAVVSRLMVNEVIAACPDEGTRMLRGLFRYIRRVGKAHPPRRMHPFNYVGSGVLFLRGDPILEEALGSAAHWVASYPRWSCLPDQDGINFGVDRRLILQLPMLLLRLGRNAELGQYMRHYAGWNKTKAFSRWRAPYDAALTEFRRR